MQCRDCKYWEKETYTDTIGFCRIALPPWLVFAVRTPDRATWHDDTCSLGEE